jgi:hypothetical protein
MDHYQVFFMVQEDAIAVSKDHQVHLITSPIDVQEKVYVLKEIGVYIFERKSLC